MCLMLLTVAELLQQAFFGTVDLNVNIFLLLQHVCGRSPEGCPHRTCSIEVSQGEDTEIGSHQQDLCVRAPWSPGSGAIRYAQAKQLVLQLDFALTS